MPRGVSKKSSASLVPHGTVVRTVARRAVATPSLRGFARIGVMHRVNYFANRNRAVDFYTIVSICKSVRRRRHEVMMVGGGVRLSLRRCVR